jgi:hypothetical protein
MSSYISSNSNRSYTVLESSYGSVAEARSADRIPAVKLAVSQQLEVTDRKDKTGSRTFPGLPPGGRRRTAFDLRTYLTSWDKSNSAPAYGPLFEASLGSAPVTFGGRAVQQTGSDSKLSFASAHGLRVSQAVATNTEIRFVAAVIDATTVQLSAPFTAAPTGGIQLRATVTYLPASDLPSVSVFDYWSPDNAVQRILCGAGVDAMEIQVNGDYHGFRFTGLARDLLDSSSFASGVAELQGFPMEPALDNFDYSVVPGHLGQAWLGNSPNQFLTVTGATVVLKNTLDTRAREFGSSQPLALVPGRRSVTAAFELFGMTDEATSGLYQAARQQSPVSVMFQLGEIEGQMLGVYLKSVVPEVPEFDDSENRLQWKFRASRAQGTVDDEIAVAFA